MATKVIEAKTISLVDGTEVKVRPLKISLLRDFMKKFADVASVGDDNDKAIDVLMECVQIAMRQYKPDLADDLGKLEENLDLPTVYKIVEEASGINLGDTALIGAKPAN